MAKAERFERAYSQGTANVMEIWADNGTGVKYVFHAIPVGRVRMRSVCTLPAGEPRSGARGAAPCTERSDANGPDLRTSGPLPHRAHDIWPTDHV